MDKHEAIYRLKMRGHSFQQIAELLGQSKQWVYILFWRHMKQVFDTHICNLCGIRQDYKVEKIKSIPLCNECIANVAAMKSPAVPID